MSPHKAGRICPYIGCPEIITGSARYCVKHTRLQNEKNAARYDGMRPSSVERGYGAAWRKIRNEFLSSHPLCWCGQHATDVDHIIARRVGGTDATSNLQALCHAHHSQKTATIDSTFANRGRVPKKES